MSNIQIGIRIPQETKWLLEKVCRSRGEDVSDFARRSILRELASLGYLSLDDQKALGVAPKRQTQDEGV
jgi:hypothetical protein